MDKHYLTVAEFKALPEEWVDRVSRKLADRIEATVEALEWQAATTKALLEAQERWAAEKQELEGMLASAADALQKIKCYSEDGLLDGIDYADFLWAKKRVENTHAWYATRIEHLKDFAKEKGIFREVCDILANGHLQSDAPSYAQLLNITRHDRDELVEAILEARESAPPGSTLEMLVEKAEKIRNRRTWEPRKP